MVGGFASFNLYTLGIRSFTYTVVLRHTGQYIVTESSIFFFFLTLSHCERKLKNHLLVTPESMIIIVAEKVGGFNSVPL